MTTRSSGSSSSSSAARAAAARRRKQKQIKRRRRIVLIGFLFLVALLIVTIIVVVRSCSATPSGTSTTVSTNLPDGTSASSADSEDSSGTASASLNEDGIATGTGSFHDGVSINGVSVSGMSISEAREAVAPALDNTLNSIAITISGQMGSYSLSETITAADMGITTDLEDILVEAASGGRNQSYNTAFIVDDSALTAKLNSINTEQSFGPTDATFEFTQGTNEKPNLVYHEGTSGYGIDVSATAQLVREALTSGNYQTTISAQLSEVQPSVTVDDLKQQCTLISSFSTEYRNRAPSSWTEERQTTIQNRSFNVEKAAEIISGEVVKPGKTWSYNDTVGTRNEKNGWKQANAIVNGESYRLEYGGGVCQVSTTLYNALLMGNIKIVSRTKHSIPADYVDYGLDATVDSGHIDFKFKNNTDYNLYIFTVHKVKSSSTRWSVLTVYIYGQALPEGVTYKPRADIVETIEPGDPIITYDKKKDISYSEVTVTAHKGYTIDVYLDKYVDGKKTDSTFLYTDKYEAITEKRTVGTIEPTPVPTATPKATATPKSEATPTPKPVIDDGGGDAE